MIIRRYLAGQLLITTVAITLLLTFILMGGRVIKFFGMAAQGKLDVELLSAVLLYRLPGFLELIIPLSLFIAVLLTFGRLYIDNEMAVMSASGISRWQMLGFISPTVLVVTLIIASFSFYLTPKGNWEYERLFKQQANRNTFDLIKPEQFQRIGDNMLYARALSSDKTQLFDVTLYSQPSNPNKKPVWLQAKTATRYFDAQTGQTYIALTDGYRYELLAGQVQYSRLQFSRYKMRLQLTNTEPEIDRARAFDSQTIYQRQQANDSLALGEWLWRWSMPLIAPIGVLLALPLAKVNPRQGRYLKLLPAILLYISFVVFIGAMRNKVDKAKVGEMAVWTVHMAYFLLALLLLTWDDLKARYQLWRQGATA
ncbi:LPS export ABC transporter permease LptF [Agitococcus lubricus]|uniref:Lipopolysaccharide export system permease protein LptF n=1 Tax=Agitococcus lubricus TaxID=1077255 RepID=A0A2T5IYQ2_9GAMM|nr:LPS export ABC transporter permease LptF [Agitococcus lubricus]PTQ89067.1 lipopolysaccharide export system permease protein [Agitococcus lubricus]